MNWFRKLTQRPARAPDTLVATLKAPMTHEEFWALKHEWQQQDMLDALRDGVQEMSGLQNVAYGTRGYSLRTLRDEGLMTCQKLSGFEQVGGVWRYTPTDAGRRTVEAEGAK